MQKQALLLLIAIFLLLPFNGIQAMESTLIIGASVSENFAAPSPGLLIAKAAEVPESNILIVAKSGKRSTYHKDFLARQLPYLHFDYVFALDLFFHDFKWDRTPSAKKVDRMHRYIEILSRSANHVYLGTAVDYLNIGAAVEANESMRTIVAKYKNVHLLDMNKIFTALSGPYGYRYTLNGKNMVIRKEDILADHLHPNLNGTRLLANLLIEKIRGNGDPRHQDFPYFAVSP